MPLSFTRIEKFIDGAFKTRSGARVDPGAEAALGEVWRSSVDPDLGRDARPAYFRGASLVVFVPSAASASRIRQNQPKVVESLRKNGLTAVESLTLKIDPGAGKTAPKANITGQPAATAGTPGTGREKIPSEVRRALDAMRSLLDN